MGAVEPETVMAGEEGGAGCEGVCQQECTLLDKKPVSNITCYTAYKKSYY